VREGFLTEAARRKDILVINAAQPIEKVQADIREAVMQSGERREERGER
jgi:thymidylate kinase